MKKTTQKRSSKSLNKKSSSKAKSSTNKKASAKRGSKKKQLYVKKNSNKNITKVIIITTLIIISLSMISLSYYLLKNPKFNITSISVYGSNKVNINEIVNKAEVKIGDNVVKSMFKINRSNLLDIPYISNVYPSIKFPSEFVIEIVERESIYFAYDREKNVYYKLNEKGIILDMCEKISLKEEELLVYGVTFDDEVILGTKINEIDYSKILVYRKIAEEFNNTFPDKIITKVNFENSLTKIYLNDKIEVILPNDTNLKYNITFLKNIINNVGDTKGTIDMTKENPTFINFHN